MRWVLTHDPKSPDVVKAAFARARVMENIKQIVGKFYSVNIYIWESIIPKVNFNRVLYNI